MDQDCVANEIVLLHVGRLYLQLQDQARRAAKAEQAAATLAEKVKELAARASADAE